MQKDNILFIGLDTHKEQTQVAYIQDDRSSEINDLGRIQSTKAGFIKLARQLQSKYPHATLHFVYEAGPCGYWIHRLHTSLAGMTPAEYVNRSKEDQNLNRANLN